MSTLTANNAHNNNNHNCNSFKSSQKVCQVCFVHDQSSSPSDTYAQCIDCNLTVHVNCYGLSPTIDLIPPLHQTFICDPCKELRKYKSNPQNKPLIKCHLCPVMNGALKRTNCNKWCHLFCALWIPEVGIANIITKTPIINLNKIPLHRKGKNCSICNNYKSKKIRVKRNHNRYNYDYNRQNNANYVCIKCEYYDCNEYVHPMCTTVKSNRGNLLIHKNDILNASHNNTMVQNVIRKLGPFLWCFLCHKHSDTNVNDIKRIEILKLLQKEWPYWKIHPNPIFPQVRSKNDDKMLAVMDIISNDNLLLEALPTQKMINRYENIIYSMHNMPLSMSTNIGPIGLLQSRIKNKYERNTKYGTNYNKTSQKLEWNCIQNMINYNISYDLSDNEQETVTETSEKKEQKSGGKASEVIEINGKVYSDDITRMPVNDKLRRDDIELSRNEVINLLWNSKEKFFNEITCEDYLRVSPYDYRYDPCFGKPVIGQPFFDKNNRKTLELTNIHHYNLEQISQDSLLLNESMSLPQPINYTHIPLIKHRLGLNECNTEIDFSDIQKDSEHSHWNGLIQDYKTNNDIMGWRWVLNRWCPPKHLESVSCICLQCRESIDIYNRKYSEAMAEYKEIEKLIPKYRELDTMNGKTKHMDQIEKMYKNDTKVPNGETGECGAKNDMQIDEESESKIVNEDNEPKVVQFGDNGLKKIPVIIKSKHGKIIADFVVSDQDNTMHTNASAIIPIDLGPNPPEIYDKMNEIWEAKNMSQTKVNKKTHLTMPSLSVHTKTSMAALEALYGQMSDANSNSHKRKYSQMTATSAPMSDPPLKRRKLNGYNIELDSFRNLQNVDLLMEKNKKDSLCKHLSDAVYELYERMRSNDSIKHMIRTNLGNTVKTKAMIQYEKLHEIVVKHSIEHSCIWLRIRTSLARGYSDLSGTFYIPVKSENGSGESDEDYSVCTACFDGSFSDDNPIVFCDECNVGIHRYCYGIIRVPNENDTWYCDACDWIRKNGTNTKPQCCLCPINGCALKQTKSGGFAHVACALWIRGIEIGDLRRMNPICGVLQVQEMQTKSAIKIHSKMLEIGLKINNGIEIDMGSERVYLEGITQWTHKCIVCEDENGCFIECAHKDCMNRMHVLCGWFAGYRHEINVRHETGSIACVVHCPNHESERDLNYFKQIRGNGTTERKNHILMEKKRQKYQKLTAKLIRFPDKYAQNMCCVCFTDYSQFTLSKCVKCGMEVHNKCYCISESENKDWECDICAQFPEYYKTLMQTESESMDVQRIFNLECIECVVCPRRGGAFKRIEIKHEMSWIHVCCGQWIDGIRFNKKENKFIVSDEHKFEMYQKCESHCYLCNKKQINAMDITVQCQFEECNKSFHIICGLFGDCHLRVVRKNNAFVFNFHCKKHKYSNVQNMSDKKENKNGLNSINVSKLGQHLCNIKRLRVKLDRIKLTSDRISEYELNQRGVVNNTTKSYKECGDYIQSKLKNHRSKKRKSSHSKKFKQRKQSMPEYKDTESMDLDSINTNRKRRKSVRKKATKTKRKKKAIIGSDEYSSFTDCNDESKEFAEKYESENEMIFTSRTTRSQNRKRLAKTTANIPIKKEGSNDSGVGIRMATDIWAEQYQYKGGEIKWPVIKRNGWFMAIPRLCLPKSNRYRYSHLERRQKQALIHKLENERVSQDLEPKSEENIETNKEWANFLQKIKEKEAELCEDKAEETEVSAGVDNIALDSRYQKWLAGGPDWELSNSLAQPHNTDHLKYDKICPYCHKLKYATMSTHNWSRHLNAKHVFKCKKCKLYFTRHQFLMKHLEDCNGELKFHP